MPAATTSTAVTLVRGDDASLVAAAARTLVRGLTGSDEAAGLGVEEYRAGQDDMSAAVDACRTLPFLTDRRVVVVRDAEQMSAEEASLFAAYLADPSEFADLVLVWGGGRVPAALDKAVKAAAGAVIDASVPSGAQGRSGWFTEKIAGSGVKLGAGARTMLTQHLGEDARRLDGLLATLEAAYGTGAKIGESELEPFLGSAGDVLPWDLTDAIDNGDAAGALRFLARMTAAGGRQALAVMAILHRHFADMLALDGTGVTGDAQAAEILGTKSTFRAGKVRRQAAKLGTQRIARAVTLLADADLDLKGGTGWPPDLTLEVLVARLARLVAQRNPAAVSRR